MFLATKWNEIIRRQSNSAKSLDDVMRQILRESRKRSREILTEYLVSVLSQHAAYDFAADVAKYVENGETIGDFKNFFGNCVEYSEVYSGKFEIGFDFETARKSRIVPDVVKNSTAEAAGVQKEQKIAGLSVYFGNINKPVELEIEENGQKRMIEYLPEATEKISIPQFKFKENLPENEKARCLSE